MRLPTHSRRLILHLTGQQLENLSAHLPKALKGTDAEDIHLLRVASRRLQQCCEILFETGQDDAAGALNRSLRRARRLFSVPRNCDVVRLRLAKMKQLRRRGSPKWWSMFDRYLAGIRKDQLRRAARKIRRKELRDALKALRKRLVEMERREAALPPAAKRRGKQVIEAHVDGLLRKAWATFSERLRHAQESRQTAALHQLRIAGKRLRYLLEVFIALQVSGARRMVHTLTRLQDSLGTLHDLVVIEELLIAAAARPEVFARHPEFGAILTRLLHTIRTMQRRQEARCRKQLERPGLAALLQPLPGTVSDSSAPPAIR